MTKKTTTNPFEFINEGNENDTNSRKLELTPVLINTSNARAVELMRTVGQEAKFHDLANKMLDELEPTDLIELIEQVFGQEVIKADSKILEGADDEQLSRLLESRRSDRSKSKSKGPRLNVAVCQSYISAMYAELLVREYWNKPYVSTSANIELDYDELAKDQDALNKKIRSLQSKKCRLNKTAPFVESDANQLEEVLSEIDRLKSLRVGTERVSTKTIIKNASVDELRKALNLIDTETLDEDQQQKLENLMEQLK